MKSDKKNKIKNRPDIIMIEVLGDRKVSINWEKAKGADAYIVRRSESADEGFKKIATLSKDYNTYIDTSIKDEGTYWYKIVSQRTEADGEIFKKACKPTSVNISSIETPKLETVLNDLKKGITLTWSSETKVDAFLIFRRHDFMKMGVKIDRVPGDCLSYTDKKSVKGPLYYYSVQGIIEQDENIQYSMRSNELPCVNLDQTKVMGIKRKLGKEIIVSLRLTSGADGYILYKSKEENGTYEPVFETNSISSFNCSDKGARKEKGAFYKAAPYKLVDGKKCEGPKTDAFYVKYR